MYRIWPSLREAVFGKTKDFHAFLELLQAFTSFTFPVLKLNIAVILAATVIHLLIV